MNDTSILLSISMLISGREDMEKSLKSLLYFKNEIPCEIILVDTGCNEEQRKIAEQYADAIYDFAWCDDFAAARNVGLQAAKGEWFMYLDDDEWFDDPREIIEFFKSGEYKEYKCATYVVRNYSNLQGTFYEDSYPSRMVQITPETKFVGRIHEYLQPFELPKKQFSDFVHHYGYAYKDDEDRRKHGERNIPPLLEMRKEHPGVPRWMAQLAQEYFSLKEYEKVVEVCVEGLTEWQALHRYVKYAPSHLGAVMGYIIVSLETLERYEEGKKWVDVALNHPLMKMEMMEPTEAFYYMAGARIFSCTNEYEKCRDYLQKYLEYYDKLSEDTAKVEKGTAGVVTGVFQEKLYTGVILMSLESLIRTEDYTLAEDVFYRLDWSDKRLLHQHKWEGKMLDAFCNVEYHPLWTRMLQTLVSREGGMEEMFDVVLELEELYEEHNCTEKLNALKKCVLSVEYEPWVKVCTKYFKDKEAKESAEDWSMDLNVAYDILDMLKTMHEAALYLKDLYVSGQIEEFNTISMDIFEGLASIQQFAANEIPAGSRIRLKDACTCGIESLKDIKMLVLTHPEKVEWKLEYELAPIIETTAMQFYYWGIVDKHPEKEDEFQEFLRDSETFGLLKLHKEERIYKYDLVISVLAYNKLDYTKQCVESILCNMPKNLNCELILVNHGSTDGTKEYFGNLNGVRVLNIAVNGAMPCMTMKAVSEGKYNLAVCNDVIIGNNAIDNIYRSMEANKDYGYVVPTTPNVSNYQTIEADYDTSEEFISFCTINNVYNENRHEQRVRLCNPMHMMPFEIMSEMVLDTYIDRNCNKQQQSFPDDKNSLWMRRKGYKCILMKDAYCHHFGSVTLKEDMGTKMMKKHFYEEGRADFLEKYGVDPWETGCHFDMDLFKVWDMPIIDNATVLGINCGFGSDSLKVKEIMKEKGAVGAMLHNVTQEECYLQDLAGISDGAYAINKLADIVEKTGENFYNYIVINAPIKGEQSGNIVQAVVDAGLSFDEMAFKNPTGDWQIARWTK